MFFSRGYNEEGIADLKGLLEAREMDYEVYKQQISVPDCENSENFVLVTNQYAIRRRSDGEIVSPMTVSAQYGEIAPPDMTGDLEPFVSEGLAVPEAAFHITQGCVQNVETIVLRLSEDPLKARLGEAYTGYIVARNYQGRGAASASLFLERQMSGSLLTALAKVSGFKIVHRGDVRDKYKLAMKRWKDLQKLMLELGNKLSSFSAIPISLIEAETLIDSLLDIQVGKDVSAQKRNLRAAYLDAFNMPRFGTFGKTVADMYHGITWVGSHYLPEKSKLGADDIMVGLLEGTRGSREQKALRLLDAFVASKEKALV